MKSFILKIDNDTMIDIDYQSKQLNISTSEFFRRAIKLFIIALKAKKVIAHFDDKEEELIFK